MLWNLNLLDARLNAVSESYGNGLWLQNGFDALTGVPLTRQSGTGGQSSNVQNLSYAWDTAGNLTHRQDLRQSLTESFTYDALDRLTLASGPAAQSTSLGYDAIGNLTSKSGIGTYTYHATRKHAVVSAGGSSYGYDANGNLTSRSGASVTWKSYNLPTKIADPNGYSATFSYAPDRSRWRQVSTYAGGSETTIYVGGLLEKLTTAARTHWKHLILTPSGHVQVIRRSDGTSATLYVTTDSLGSTDAVLNAAGAVLMRGSFTVHGARRASNWQGAPSSGEWQSIADTTRRGYTGHEQLDNILLVHMNGRVFDPAIGRFLSADPYIDGPETTQGWNRYAYVQGRVVSATDPSGFVNSLMWEFSMGRLVKRDGTSGNSGNTNSGNTTTERFVGGPGAIGPSQSYVRGSRGGIEYPPQSGYRDLFGNPVVVASRPIFTMGSIGDFFSTSIIIRSAGGAHRSRLGDGNGGGGGTVNQDGTRSARCPAPPPAPPGVNVDVNIEIARDHFWGNPGSVLAAVALVQNHGDWDYKRRGSGNDYEDFGNFNYGAITAAMGIPYFLSQNAAGIYQQARGDRDAGFGVPFIYWPYGDDNVDAYQILRGMVYVENGCDR